MTTQSRNQFTILFDITDFGPAHHIIGIDIAKKDQYFTTPLSRYVRSILITFLMSECKSTDALGSPNRGLTKTSWSMPRRLTFTRKMCAPQYTWRTALDETLPT